MRPPPVLSYILWHRIEWRHGSENEGRRRTTAEDDSGATGDEFEHKFMYIMHVWRHARYLAHKTSTVLVQLVLRRLLLPYRTQASGQVGFPAPSSPRLDPTRLDSTRLDPFSMQIANP
jgi:hypothetical protein